jgi:two-component sensor histidine kinase
MGSFQRTPIITASVEMARNAILHADGGVFAMELAPEGEDVVLTISTSDEGRGIPEAMVDVAHDRRLAPLTPEESGVGLRGIARLSDQFSIKTSERGSEVRAGFVAQTDQPIADLARRISDTLIKLEEADRATALAEQNKELLQALSDRDLMLQEIHHRTQNNLALISSLVSLRGAAAESDEVKEALLDVSARIRSIAAVHSQLQRTDDFESLELLPFIQLIVNQMVEALSNDFPVRCQVVGANPSVSPRQAVDLSLLVGELVTNSFKHAFAEQPDPEVVIEIGVAGTDLTLVVHDNGCGLPDGSSVPSASSSLGWKVIRSIPAKYQGTIEVDGREGLKVAVQCQLDSPGSDPASPSLR